MKGVSLIFAPSKAALSRSEAAFAAAVRDNGRFHDSDKTDAVWHDVKAGAQLVGSGSDPPG